jgi:hypothetical protein
MSVLGWELVSVLGWELVSVSVSRLAPVSVSVSVLVLELGWESLG